MKIYLKISRIFSLKYIVGFSLIVSLIGMSTILGIGYAQVWKTNSDKNQIDVSEEIPAVQRQIETTVQTVGGEGGTPTITIKTTPEKVAPGESSTIDWEAKDAEVCAASGAWSGVKNSVGNQDTGALQETQKYTLTCTNSKGPTTVDTTVTVDASLTPISSSAGTGNTTSTPAPSSGGSATPQQPSTPSTSNGGSTGSPGGGTTSVAPVLTMSISTGSITAGASATISWTINGTASPTPTCSASGSWSGSKATSGGENVSPGAGSYNYSLSCSNNAGTSSKSVSLSVTSASTCGTGGSCSLTDIQSRNSPSNCWTAINGNVYSITQTFLTSTHTSTLGGPSISSGSLLCGKSYTGFNGKHNNGNRTGGGHTATWWLTGNGNTLIGPYGG